MKKSRKQINKIVLRFFAFVSFLSVTLSAFCIGGNALYDATLQIPSVNVDSEVGLLKHRFPYVEFRNSSLRYSNAIGYYNTILLCIPKYITNTSFQFVQNNNANQKLITTKLAYFGFSSTAVSGSDEKNLLISIVNPDNSVADGSVINFPYSSFGLYYNEGHYYVYSASYKSYLSENAQPNSQFRPSSVVSGNFLASSVYSSYFPLVESSVLAYPAGMSVVAGSNQEIARLNYLCGGAYNYAWDLSNAEVDLGTQEGTIVIDFTPSSSSCTCNCGDNVCDCDCGFYTEQLKEDLIDYFDTNVVSKSMFLQYMSNLQSLAESYSSIARDYSIQANNYSSLAGGYSQLARSYSELATELSGNQSLQEEQNSMIAEQNSIDNSRYNVEQSSRNAEQSNLDNIASGTTSPDSQISGGVAQLSSKFDIYFNQIESFQSGLQTVPEEVSQAGVMVTNITNKLPNSIKVAIIFVLLVLVVVKVLGR